MNLFMFLAWIPLVRICQGWNRQVPVVSVIQIEVGNKNFVGCWILLGVGCWNFVGMLKSIGLLLSTKSNFFGVAHPQDILTSKMQSGMCKRPEPKPSCYCQRLTSTVKLSNTIYGSCTITNSQLYISLWFYDLSVLTSFKKSFGSSFYHFSLASPTRLGLHLAHRTTAPHRLKSQAFTWFRECVPPKFCINNPGNFLHNRTMIRPFNRHFEAEKHPPKIFHLKHSPGQSLKSLSQRAIAHLALNCCEDLGASGMVKSGNGWKWDKWVCNILRMGILVLDGFWFSLH